MSSGLDFHNFFTLTRSLFVLDCETTGVNQEKDRIVEFGFQQYTSAGLIKTWSARFNPGIPIPEAAQATHKITDEDVAGKPSFGAYAQHLAKGLSDCDFAGKDVRFDLGIIDAEMHRAGVLWSYDRAYIIDARRLEEAVIPRTLEALYKKYTGQDLLDAHGADADVEAAAMVIRSQLAQHLEVLPWDLKLLHDLQWPGWLDIDGKFCFRDGTVVVNFGHQFKGTPLEEVAKQPRGRGYLQWICRGQFKDDTKQIAHDALAGKFPVAPQ